MEVASKEFRKLDGLYRVPLPQDMCRHLGLMENTPVDITENKGCIEIRKAVNTCIFCGNENQADLFIYERKIVCRKCAEKIGEKRCV